MKTLKKTPLIYIIILIYYTCVGSYVGVRMWVLYSVTKYKFSQNKDTSNK